ncbi:MAG TPA: hypothetical protein VNG53_06165 [Bacteroidia bacterium]|nr:hypothetical protein [Bacteroidia bacterium]
MTYPYMHDGRFYTLNQVLDHYTQHFDKNSGADQILVKGMNLTEQNKLDVIAFFKTLTDKEFLHDKRFANPNFLR